MGSSRCHKCGRGIYADDLPKHRRFCDKAPLPEDMAREIMASSLETVYTMSVKYGLTGSSNDVRQHVHFGLLKLGINRSDALSITKERSESRMAVRHDDTSELIVKMPDPSSPDSKQCSKCEILTTARDSYGRPLCELCSNDISWRDALDIKELKAL